MLPKSVLQVPRSVLIQFTGWAPGTPHRPLTRTRSAEASQRREERGPMRHQVVCRIRADEPGRTLEFTWSVGSSAFPPYSLRDDQVEQFRGNALAARDGLFELVSLYQPAADERDGTSLRRCCLNLAQAGRNLYNLI